jgi:hypothetical protein
MLAVSQGVEIHSCLINVQAKELDTSIHLLHGMAPCMISINKTGHDQWHLFDSGIIFDSGIMMFFGIASWSQSMSCVVAVHIRGGRQVKWLAKAWRRYHFEFFCHNLGLCDVPLTFRLETDKCR